MDMLTRSWIGIAVATATTIAALSMASEYVGPKIKNEIGKTVGAKEDAIFSAILSYMQKNSTNPSSMNDLITSGFLGENLKNGDDGEFSFVVDAIKNTITISSTFTDEAILLAHLNNVTNWIKPVRSEMTLSKTFIIPSANQAFLMAYTGATPPASGTFSKWYDTSGDAVVLKMFDAATSTWKEFSSGVVSSGTTSTNIGTSILSSKTSLIGESASDGDIRYVNDSSSNSIVKYTSYNGVWYGENGSSVAQNLSNGVLGDCPSGFVFIPGSNASEYQTIDRGSSTISSYKGWCVAKSKMQYYYTANKGNYFNTTNGYYGYASTRLLENQKVSAGMKSKGFLLLNSADRNSNDNYYFAAKNLCESNVVDNEGNHLEGSMMPFKLFKLLFVDTYSNPSNWTAGTVESTPVTNSNRFVMTYNYNSIGISDDNDGYFGVTSPGTDNEYRRTKYLSNGEVIWDFVGHHANPTTLSATATTIAENEIILERLNGLPAQNGILTTISSTLNTRSFGVGPTGYDVFKYNKYNYSVPNAVDLSTVQSVDRSVVSYSAIPSNDTTFEISANAYGSTDNKIVFSTFRCVVPAK